MSPAPGSEVVTPAGWSLFISTPERDERRLYQVSIRALRAAELQRSGEVIPRGPVVPGGEVIPRGPVVPGGKVHLSEMLPEHAFTARIRIVSEQQLITTNSFGELASVAQDVRSQGTQPELNLRFSVDADPILRRLGSVEVAAEQRSNDVQDGIRALTDPSRKRRLIMGHALERLDVDAGPVAGIQNLVYRSLVQGGASLTR